jgi:hypothetical protein
MAATDGSAMNEELTVEIDNVLSVQPVYREQLVTEPRGHGKL